MIITACNILTEGTAPFYTLSNYGANMNCTLTALYPAVVAVRTINIGTNGAVLNYDVRQFSIYIKICSFHICTNFNCSLYF